MSDGKTVMMVYMTASNDAEAGTLARALVEARLAACVNVLGPIRSVYWWEGKVQEEGEVALVAKTTAATVDALIAEVKRVHSYTTPCVVAWSLEAGNVAFLDWVGAETGDAQTPP